MRIKLAIVIALIVGTMSKSVAEDDVITEWVTTDIIYIGTNAYAPKNIDAAQDREFTISTYNLDTQRNLEKQLSEGLPTDPSQIEEAERIAGERFEALPIADLQAIFRPVILVAKWDIRKVPAFVFGDGGAVIYGLTDVDAALDHWQAWREERGSQ